MHRFYHIDRERQLTEGKVINLDDRGLSRFGSVYWDAISTKPFEALNDAEQRECLLEQIKQEPNFSLYASRMQAFFGANTLEDAKRFAEKIVPKPVEKIPIFEVFASTFWTLDMNWLDYVSDPETRIRNLRDYWYATISNHNPSTGERKPPHLEVMMALPITIGRIVEWI